MNEFKSAGLDSLKDRNRNKTKFDYSFKIRVIIWNVSRNPIVDFVVTPLAQLLSLRPELNYRMTIHSDQGIQYQNKRYVTLLKANKVFQSMSRKATCLDNAVAESIFHLIKVGTVHNNHFDTYANIEVSISNYVYYQ